VTRGVVRALGSLSFAVLVLPACGKKGDPLPPLPIVPAPVADLTASVSDGRVTLEFTVPAANPDDPTSAAPQRIEIYRTVNAEKAPPPAFDTVIGRDEYRRHEIPVRPPEAPAPAGEAAGPPAPGDRATFAEPIDTSSDALSWTYAVVSATGRNRRGAPATVTIPIATLPPAPEGVSLSHDERSLVVSWTGDTAAYRVFSVADPSGSASPVPLTAKPIAEPRFSVPVEFGRERCFTVRTVAVAGNATVEGPSSPVVCLTPTDRYPPPAPTGLRAIQDGTAITLTWDPSEASDLAGYVVLRGDETGTNLQPLVREPVREPTYRDASVQSGSTYTYSVYAVDTAATPNVSQQSDRQVVTVR
jgi:hypothetical protein